MRRSIVAAACIVAFALADGCRPNLELPPGARISCATDSDCPGSRVCRNLRCVDADNAVPALALTAPIAPFRITTVLIDVSVVDEEEETVTIDAELEYRGGRRAIVLQTATVPASPVGQTAQLVWDARSHFGSTARRDGLIIYLTPRDASGARGATVASDPFVFGEEQPVIRLGDVAPAQPARRFVNRVELPVAVTDPNPEETVALTIEYRVDIPAGACSATPTDPSCDADGWCPATPEPDSPSVSALAPSGSVVFVWSTLGDADGSCGKGLGRAYVDTDADGDSDSDDTLQVAYTPLVTVRVTPADSSGVEGDAAVTALDLGNDATVATLQPFSSRNAQEVPVKVELVDPASDVVDIEVQFQLPGESAWRAAYPGAAGLFHSLTTTPDGQLHVVTWDSSAEPIDGSPTQPQGIGNSSATGIAVRSRAIKNVDALQSVYGLWSAAESVDVRNQTVPRVENVRVIALENGDITAPVPVFYTLVDDEGDPADIHAEYCIDSPCDQRGQWQPCHEYRAPQSEGLYDLATAPSSPSGGGGVEHVFMWDPGEVLVNAPRTTRIRLLAFDRAARPEESVTPCGVGDRATCMPLPARLASRPSLPDCGGLSFDDCSGLFGCSWDTGDSSCAPPAFAAGSRPRALLTADVNGDGILDVLTANYTSDDVSVLLGLNVGGVATGTFGAPTPFAAGDSPESVVAADVNGDGILDILTANVYSDDVSVLLGQGSGGVGNGTFAGPSPFAAGIGPKDLAAADVNGDEILDIVTANDFSDDVTVLIGQGSMGVGDGTFAAPAAYAAADGPRALDVGDVDSDGILDLVVACAISGDVAILPGSGSGGLGDGTFDAAVLVAAGKRPEDLMLADVNSDGISDVLVADYNADAVLLLIGLGAPGSGDGTFAAPLSFTVGDAPMGLAAGDINGDGILDVITANDYSDDVTVLVGGGHAGRGNGSFAPGVTLRTGASPYDVQIADLDRDGDRDVITSNNGSDDVTVLSGLVPGGAGDGTFPLPVAFAADADANAVAVADLNVDGIVDAVTSDSGASGISVLLGEGSRGIGNGAFAAALHFATGTNEPWSVRLADVNSDGVLDVLTVDSSTDDVALLLGQSTNGMPDGTFADPASFATAGSSPIALLVADLDGDRILDLVTCNLGSDNISVLEGRGTGGAGDGTFEAPETFAAGDGPRALVAADVNGDSVLDLLTANSGSNDVAVLLGDGDGAFAAAAFYAAGTAPWDLLAADVNGDGILDVATANDGSDDVTVLIGDGAGGVGTGSFGAPNPFPAGNGPVALAVPDLDGDGVLDILAANQFTEDVTVLVGAGVGGIGNGSFMSLGSFPVGRRPFDLAVYDANADGVVDVLTANYVSDDVTLLLGLGATTSAAREVRLDAASASELGRAFPIGVSTVEPLERCDRGAQDPGSLSSSCVYTQAAMTIQTAGIVTSLHAEARRAVPSLSPSSLPLTPPRRALGDVRWSRVSEPANPLGVTSGPRSRVEQRFGPYRCGDGAIEPDREACDDGARTPGDGCSVTCAIERDWSCTGEPSQCTAAPGAPGESVLPDFDRWGLDASLSEAEQRALVVPLAVFPGRCQDVAPANGRCDLLDPVNGMTVRVFRRSVDWARADDVRFQCGAIAPPNRDSPCTPGAALPARCDPLSGAANAGRYLPFLPECVATGGGGGVVRYREVVEEVVTWTEIQPDDGDDDLTTGNGPRFLVVEGGRANENTIMVLTDRLGTFLAFVELP